MTSISTIGQSGESKGLVRISWKSLAPWAFGYVLLPVVVFSLLWLRPAVGILVACAVVAAGVLAVCPAFLERVPWLGSQARWRGAKLPSPFVASDETDGHSLRLSWKVLLALAAVAVAWCFFGGQGSMWAQSTDWTVRNAVFQDLILRSWPVYYNDGATALVYYINHWMVPAALARAAFIVTGSASVALGLGNALLLAWTSAGVFLVELLVIVLLRATKVKAIVFAVALLVLFSGMDALGIAARALAGIPLSSLLPLNPSDDSLYLHVEWWAGLGAYQLSSNTTLLFWVFNQTVIPWICTCMLLLSRNVSSVALIVVACLASGPYAGVGLAVIGFVLVVASLVKGHRCGGSFSTWAYNLVSPVNVLATVPAVVYAAYYLCNQSINTSGSRLNVLGPLPEVSIAVLVLFLVVEVGVYLAIVGIGFWREPLFWAVALLLLVAPFIHMGSPYEFCCRATIPALFCLMLMCGAFLMNQASSGSAHPVASRMAALALAACLAVGAITPLTEFARGTVAVADKGIAGAVQPASDLENAPVEEGRANNFKTIVHPEALYFRLFAG